jgi:RNA recognition motif-containing protein
MGKKLYVGNLPFDVTVKELEDFFAQTVACETASVITDRFTGQSRGFGFVEMRSDDDAQRAIEQLNGQELKGRALKINEAREQTGGGGGRGGFGGGGGGRGGYGGGGGGGGGGRGGYGGGGGGYGGGGGGRSGGGGRGDRGGGSRY